MILRLSLCVILTFLNFQASNTYSTEIKRKSTTSLYLLLPGNNIIKIVLFFIISGSKELFAPGCCTSI
jgi:hypothetical protein